MPFYTFYTVSLSASAVRFVSLQRINESYLKHLQIAVVIVKYVFWFPGNNVKHVLKGKHDTCFQYHYHMETQICLVVPRFDGLDVFPATQWIDYVKIAVAGLLQILESK